MTPGDTADDIAASATQETLGDLDVLFNVVDTDFRIGLESTCVLIEFTFEVMQRGDNPRKLDEFELVFDSRKHRETVDSDHDWTLKATKDDVRSLGAPPIKYGMSASHLSDAQFDTVMEIAEQVVDEKDFASHFTGNPTFTIERGQHFTYDARR